MFVITVEYWVTKVKLKYIALDIYRYPILRLNHLLYQRMDNRSRSSSSRNRSWFHRHSQQQQVTFHQENLLSQCQARVSNSPVHPHYVCVDCLSLSHALQRMHVPVLPIHRGMRLLMLCLCFLYTVHSESSCALRLWYVDMVVIIEVAVQVCNCLILRYKNWNWWITFQHLL
jgi:hypothetical protein